MQEAIVVSTQAVDVPAAAAGFWRRFAAQAVDMLLHYVTWYLAALLTGILIALYLALAGQDPEPVLARLSESTTLGFVFAMVGSVLYHTVCEGLHGATLGKLICGLHVLAQDGRRASLAAALVRSLAIYIDGIFFGAIGAMAMSRSPLQQRNGDKWAKTIVVQRSKWNPPRWPSAWIFVLAFILGVAADGLMAALSILINLP